MGAAWEDIRQHVEDSISNGDFKMLEEHYRIVRDKHDGRFYPEHKDHVADLSVEWFPFHRATPGPVKNYLESFTTEKAALRFLETAVALSPCCAVNLSGASMIHSEMSRLNKE